MNCEGPIGSTKETTQSHALPICSLGFPMPDRNQETRALHDLDFDGEVTLVEDETLTLLKGGDVGSGAPSLWTR